MTAGRPSDYRGVVHPVRMETQVFIVAARPPCIRLRDEAARPKGRDYRTALLGDLAGLDLPGRWVMAAILCPGDSSRALVAWMQAQGADPERILFVLHPETDAVEALRAWYGAGYGDPVVCEARTLKEFARTLGQFVNDWIYVDAKGLGWPL